VSAYAGLPHRGGWLVYLNGLEVPCTSIQVNYGVGMIPEAALSFPPHRLLHRLGAEDRIEVVVFYLDDLADPANPEFRLLFEGELLGWSYTSSSAGRQMTFNATADISIFTQLYFFFLNNVDAITSFVAQQGSGAAGVPTAGAVYPFSLFKKGLLFTEGPPKPESPPRPDITRPYEIIYNVIRGMIDSEISPKLRAIPSVNFFSRWVRKRNFVNRFAALPVFEDGEGTPKVFPILEAAQAETAMQAMQNNVSTAVGNAGTIWEVLQEVYGHVLFEIAMLPTAPCARVKLADGMILRPGTVIDSTPGGVDPKEPIRLVNYFVKPQMYFGIAPTCNLLFPSMISNYSYSESYLAQPTRTYVNDQFISGILPQNVATTSALTFGFPEEVGAVLKDKMGDAHASAQAAAQADGKKTGPVARPGNVSKSGKNMLVFPEEFFKGPVIHRMPVPSWFTYLQNKAPSTTNTPTTKPPAANVEEARSLSVLMASYVEWEHYRARYEKRGGAVNMAWNPYVVPGFPCVIFDQKSSAFHTVGYLNSVHQSLDPSGMSTAINYTMSRTVPEMLELLQADLQRNPGKVFGSAPLEPVTPVRDIIQNFEQAETFYQALFFQREPMPQGKPASFDFRDVLGYDNGDGTTDPIVVEEVKTTTTTTGGSSTNVNASTTQSTIGAGETTETTLTTTTTKIVTTLTGTRNVVPLPGYVPVFTQYDTAMRYVARPICSITDYVSFLHGGKTLDQLREIDTDVDDNATGAQVEDGDNRFGKVIYFKRIKRLTQGPGTTPPDAMLGVSGTGDATTAYTGIASGVSENIQTRADWDSALEAYRAEMYSRLGPQE
jgi:hypothetical protein